MDVMLTSKMDLSYRSIKSKVTEAKMDLGKEKSDQTQTKVRTEQDSYERSTPEAKVTYEKPKVDQKTIQQLKAESDRAYNQLKQIVTAMLRRQGLEFQDLSEVKPEDLSEVIIDETAQREAQAQLEEGGDQSPGKVSDRIVDFAKAISGGDKSKFALLKSAIDAGFKAARSAFGDELPEICQETYKLTMEKLEAWVSEGETAASSSLDESSANGAPQEKVG